MKYIHRRRYFQNLVHKQHSLNIYKSLVLPAYEMLDQVWYFLMTKKRPFDKSSRLRISTFAGLETTSAKVPHNRARRANTSQPRSTSLATEFHVERGLQHGWCIIYRCSLKRKVLHIHYSPISYCPSHTASPKSSASSICTYPEYQQNIASRTRLLPTPPWPSAELCAAGLLTSYRRCSCLWNTDESGIHDCDCI